MPVRIGLSLLLLTLPPLAAAELSWSTAGPFGASLRCLVVDPVEPARLYACAAPGGLFRSDDAGATWEPKTDGLGFALSALDFVVDPQDANRVYLAFDAPERSGVLRSNDRGETWSAASSGLPGGGFLPQDLEIDPGSPNRIWLSYFDETVYRSQDAGATWQDLSAPVSGSGRLLAVAAAPQARLYLGTGTGLWRSLDGGGSWASLPTGVGGAVEALASDPTSPLTLYAAQGEFISRTVDGGATWTNVDTGFPGGEGLFQYLRVDPTAPATVYAAGERGLDRSVDSGATWAPFEGTDLPTANLTLLAGPATSGSVLYAAGPRNAGVFQSTDTGATWGAVNTGLAATEVAALVVDPSTPTSAFAAVGGVGVFRSLDGGGSWGVPSGPLEPRSLAVGAGVVWAGTVGGRVWRSVDGGGSWSDLGVVTGAATTVSALLAHPTDPLTAWAFAANAFRTVDGGSTWVPVASGLAGGAVLDAVLDPANPLTLYAATSTNAVFKSLDGAASWASARSGLTPNRIGDVALSTSAPTNLFALADAFGASSVWESLDGAGGWVERPLPFAGWQLQALAAEPAAASTAYLAALEVDPFLGTEGRAEVFALRTLGGSCSTVAPGLPPLSGRRLAVGGSPASHLYLATRGRGVWTVSGVDAIVFGDGFESGTTAAWSAVVP